MCMHHNRSEVYIFSLYLVKLEEKKTTTDFKKYKSARKEAQKALEEKKRIWTLAQGPAAKMVADMTLKKDLGPVIIPERMKNPNGICIFKRQIILCNLGLICT